MNSDISVLADELGYGLFGELDYTLEATNANEFGASVRHLPYVKVPRTLPRLTRKRVLTMEWITGYRPLDLQLIAEGNRLSEEGLSGISRQEAKLYLDDLVSLVWASTSVWIGGWVLAEVLFLAFKVDWIGLN